MSHFAKVENGIVTQVIVAEQDFIDSGAVGNPELWVQTSYNTRAGVHRDRFGRDIGKEPLRKNYAGIGYIYDKNRDAFYPPKPMGYNSWKLNEETCLWEAPIPIPDPMKAWKWNEAKREWIEIPPPDELKDIVR